MKEHIGLILPLMVTVIGWFVGSWLTQRSKIKQERKDRMYSYLTDAYFCASEIRANDFKSQDDLMRKLFKITQNVSLYGSKTQIELVADFFSEVGLLIQAGNKFDKSEELHDLVLELREDIRAHLGLRQLQGKVPNLAKT